MKIKQKVLLLILTIAIVMTFMPVIAFADDHQVTTVQKDTYVYCGGTYDLEVFFASANSQKLQAKMEKFASPFWRKLQAVRHSSSTADMLLS